MNTKAHKEFRDRVRFSSGENLSGANEIYYDLIVELEKVKLKYPLQKRSDTNSDYLNIFRHFAINRIINRIQRGEYIDPNNPVNQKDIDLFRSDDIRSKLTSTPDFDLIVTDIRKLVQTASEKYISHNNRLYEGFKKILAGYETGDAYHDQGKDSYEKDPNFADFIKLIHRIALIDQINIAEDNKKFQENPLHVRKNFISQLKKFLEDIEKNKKNEDLNPFNHEMQAQFLGFIYQFFGNWEEHSFQLVNGNEQHDQYKASLKKNYSSHVTIERLYRDIVISNIQIPAKTKLIYDIKQIKDAIDENNDNLFKQAKEFKKDIHHVAQRLGLPSCIKLNKQKSKYKRYEVSNNPQDWKDIINIEKQDDRRIKARNASVASKSAFVNSIGEGFVAAAGILAITTFLPGLLGIILGTIVGVSGWFINRLLFKNDSEECLNAFFLSKRANDGKRHLSLFVNNKGDVISNGKKVLISFIGFFTIFTGFVYGALNFMSTSSTLMAMTGSMAGQLGVMFSFYGLAAVPGLGMIIGLSSIFFKVIADFIKNDRHKDIRNYVEKTFLDVPWKEMSAKERWKHIGRCAVKTCVLLVALAITVTVTLASFGVFYQQGLDVLRMMSKANVMNYLAKAASWINAVVSFPFQVLSSNKVLQSLFDSRPTFAKVNWPKTEAEPATALGKREALKRKALKIIAYTATFFNSLGQAGINMQGSSIPLPSFIPYAPLVGRGVVGIATAFYSGNPNQAAAKSAIEEKEIKATEILPNTQPQETHSEASEANANPVQENKQAKVSYFRFFKHHILPQEPDEQTKQLVTAVPMP